jgi:hypothetical protein
VEELGGPGMPAVAGMPYSLATTAPWDNCPPLSVVSPQQAFVIPPFPSTFVTKCSKILCLPFLTNHSIIYIVYTVVQIITLTCLSA